MRLPLPIPCKVPRLFLIKMLISDLNSAAVAAVEIQASANRALTCKCSLCSCVTVTSRSACEHTLESSGRNRCKLSTLINNAGNTVREGTAVDTVLLQPLRLPPFLCSSRRLPRTRSVLQALPHHCCLRKLPMHCLLWRLLLRCLPHRPVMPGIPPWKQHLLTPLKVSHSLHERMRCFRCTGSDTSQPLRRIC